MRTLRLVQRHYAELDHIARSLLAEVERKLADLTNLRGELRQLIDQCERGTVTECRIIETLAPAQKLRKMHMENPFYVHAATASAGPKTLLA